MSAQPNFEPAYIPELQIISNAEHEQTAIEYAQMRPEQLYDVAKENPEVAFKAAQLALSHTIDPLQKIQWINIMYRAMGPSGDI